MNRALLLGALLVVVAVSFHSKLPDDRTFKDVTTTAHFLSFSLVKAVPRAVSVFQFLFTTLGFPRFRVNFMHRDSDSKAAFTFVCPFVLVTPFCSDSA